MPVQLYFDAHVPSAICDELRRKGVDVLTAQEDAADELEDDDLLLRATGLGRVIFTQDSGFKGLAETWQQQRKPFAGLAFCRQS